MKTDKINATLIQRHLSPDLVEEINSKNDWSDTLWGPAYLSAGFADAEKGISNSDLFTLIQHGIYQPAGRYRLTLDGYTELEQIDLERDLKPAADRIFQWSNIREGDLSTIDEVWRMDKAYSMSVGDLVYFELIDVCLVCCNTGWKQLPDIQRDLVNHQTAQIRGDIAIQYKQDNCECGLDEKGQWSEKVFDRFGCECV
jgi:hypothetical protein